MASSTSEAKAVQPRKTPVSMMTLPTEVRHRIYRELLYQPAQILLRHHVPILVLFGRSAPPSTVDPVFQTQVFRVNKEIHDDAMLYAYGLNDFQLRDDFAAFCGLGRAALEAMANVSILPTMWREEGPKETEMWSKLNLCTNLHRLELQLHPEVLLPAVRWFAGLSRELSILQRRPRIILDFCVWERHLIYDPHPLDYQRTRTLIENGIASGDLRDASVNIRHKIRQLPLQARNILLTADLSSAAVRALDDYLSGADQPLFTKTVADLPSQGSRAIGGRERRLWYELQVH
ncbi:uncharacterized protein AB675_9294 [Cyphellophora attinorum]|uniref:Uncharacterized protein n=1 Tax=Cyphellophora attinorum TaxID=1664694 RepID=A0A0N1HB51_9EURO|nr:uncharacterized protein AB675_9294 [Phialophora attinorum]KPI41447.1 hypothetical protein AB675_9294 [Phialophora attinorum]